MDKYLVTGGAGFIGSNIVERLVLDGADVRVLDKVNKTYFNVPPGVFIDGVLFSDYNQMARMRDSERRVLLTNYK